MRDINTKLVLAGAFLSALVFPFLAGAQTASTSSQDVTITIDKAAEVVDPSAAVSFSNSAPSGSSNVNADSSASAITGGHRSNASWTITTQEVTPAANMTNKLRVQNGCTGTYNEVNSTGTTSDSGSKNSSNSLEAARTACFRQPISWADQAGAKTVVVSHTLSNGA